ncbi:kinase-like protein [Whalleya microplaca]|nr:kinase-like protein [Whalleya microplaca]
MNQNNPRPNLLQLARQAGTDSRYLVVLRRAHEIRQCFEQEARRFVFEDLVGYGQYGVACRILQRDSGWFFWRTAAKRFVVKHSLGDAKETQALMNEIQMLQGASHILQPFAITDNPLLQAFDGPSLITEYAEHGTLGAFIVKAAAWGQPLPNRLLWRLFLCLLRFVIAMAWPDVDIKEQVPEQEEIRAQKSQIVHNDMHTRNIMIGSFDKDEHFLVPILKLIDFGLARNAPSGLSFLPTSDAGVKQNIYDIGVVMLDLITGTNLRPTRRALMDVRIYNRSILINSAAVAIAPPRFPNLDPDLRGLVVWCCAANMDDRPYLETLANIISQQVETKTAASYAGYPLQVNETDERVAAIVARLLDPSSGT